jgi:hypothetical protein
MKIKITKTNIDCKFCNETIPIKNINRHLEFCICQNVCLNDGYLIQFISKSDLTKKNYHLFVNFGTACKFSDIDYFIKNIWFNQNIDVKTKSTIIYENQNSVEKYNKINFNTLISKFENIENFLYTYNILDNKKNIIDTTDVYFRILKKYHSVKKTKNILLIFQNDYYLFRCHNNKNCNKDYCSYIYNNDFYCDVCINNSSQIDINYTKYKIIPLINSPKIICF